jgi:hypothetical protein
MQKMGTLINIITDIVNCFAGGNGNAGIRIREYMRVVPGTIQMLAKTDF